MFQKSSTPGGGPLASNVDAEGMSLDQLEYVMSSRLAGEALANALFLADSSLAETLKETLPLNASNAVSNARMAIARAARSGLVLLTAAKSGCEPVDNVNLIERVALAASMLRRLVPQGPRIEIAKNAPEEVFARIPVGLPARLLVRTVACFPSAQRIWIDAERKIDRGLDVAELRFRADEGLVDKWLPRVAELLDITGGTLLASKKTIIGRLPASWDISSDTTAGETFVEERTPHKPDTTPKPPTNGRPESKD